MKQSSGSVKPANASGFHSRRKLSTRIMGKNINPSTCQGHTSLDNIFCIRFLLCFPQSIFCTPTDYRKLYLSHLHPCCEYMQLPIQMHKCELWGNKVPRLPLESAAMEGTPSLQCRGLSNWLTPDVLSKTSWRILWMPWTLLIIVA